MPSGTEGLVEAWRVNNRINLFLLDRITDAGMASTTSTRGGRNVARQFAHLHNNRVDFLMHHAPRDLSEGIVKFEGSYSPTKEELKTALESSAESIARLIEHSMNQGGTIRAFRRGVFAAFGYLVAHDSHHRGSILLTLKLTGNKLDSDAQYLIWDWNNR
ncbi:MAG: hypothetical protein JO033_10810 [Acidobacteriaceae bacterium]|nr:hypothetical protein [Acidobacteriaceae bacterium]MBV9501376.1 hypothetical protein [Acidobacteriaceae bacterium]